MPFSFQQQKEGSTNGYVRDRVPIPVGTRNSMGQLQVGADMKKPDQCSIQPLPQWNNINHTAVLQVSIRIQSAYSPCLGSMGPFVCHAKHGPGANENMLAISTPIWSARGPQRTYLSWTLSVINI